jgi:hypothetical protein
VPVTVPAQSDWTDSGVIFTASELSYGSNLDDSVTPGPVFERDGTYYLYYIVADGTREFDGGPKHRAVCLARTDTVDEVDTWENYDDNPVLTWRPNEGTDIEPNDEEEGVFSLGGVVHEGTWYLYYSAMTRVEGTNLVGIDVRLATSSDGTEFTDRGIVLDHEDDDIYLGGQGNAGELWAMGATVVDDTFYVYYYDQNETGVAYSEDPLDIAENTESLLGSYHSFTNPIPGNESVYFFPTRGGRDSDPSNIVTDVYETDVSRPNNPGELVERYEFTDYNQASLFRGESKWYMFYQTPNLESFRLRCAPAL